MEHLLAMNQNWFISFPDYSPHPSSEFQNSIRIRTAMRMPLGVMKLHNCPFNHLALNIIQGNNFKKGEYQIQIFLRIIISYLHESLIITLRKY